MILLFLFCFGFLHKTINSLLCVLNQVVRHSMGFKLILEVIQIQMMRVFRHNRGVETTTG